MRQLKKRIATPDQEESVRHAVRWCKRHHMEKAGLYYDDPLANADGVTMIIFATTATPDEQIRKAIDQAYVDGDIVSYYTLVCPEDWLA